MWDGRELSSLEMVWLVLYLIISNLPLQIMSHFSPVCSFTCLSLSFFLSFIFVLLYFSYEPFLKEDSL